MDNAGFDWGVIWAGRSVEERGAAERLAISAPAAPRGRTSPITTMSKRRPRSVARKRPPRSPVGLNGLRLLPLCLAPIASPFNRTHFERVTGSRNVLEDSKSDHRKDIERPLLTLLFLRLRVRSLLWDHRARRASINASRFSLKNSRTPRYPRRDRLAARASRYAYPLSQRTYNVLLLTQNEPSLLQSNVVSIARVGIDISIAIDTGERCVLCR